MIAAMKRKAPQTIMALLVGALLCLASSAWAVPFSFVALADSRGPSAAEPLNRPVISAMVAKILTLAPRPAFVLFPGDMVMGTHEGTDGLADQLRGWQQAVSPLAAAGIRVYCVPGNHEISGRSAAEKEKVYIAVLGQAQYVFRHEGSVFIGLNTDRPGAARSPDLAWLKEQLAAAQGAEHVFVFGHEPADPVTGPDQGLKHPAAFWQVIEGGGADAYICGHEHLYARSQHSGVLQVVSGGAGGPLLPLGGAPGFGAVESAYHLTLWRVDGPKVEMRALSLERSGQWRQIDSYSYVKARAPKAPAIQKASAPEAATPAPAAAIPAPAAR
jgi:3',5'-cyclic AMP phosphodiesterase CpdA